MYQHKRSQIDFQLKGSAWSESNCFSFASLDQCMKSERRGELRLVADNDKSFAMPITSALALFPTLQYDRRP
jgi:hypothetical protein